MTAAWALRGGTPPSQDSTFLLCAFCTLTLAWIYGDHHPFMKVFMMRHGSEVLQTRETHKLHADWVHWYHKETKAGEYALFEVLLHPYDWLPYYSPPPLELISGLSYWGEHNGNSWMEGKGAMRHQNGPQVRARMYWPHPNSQNWSVKLEQQTWNLQIPGS